MLINVDNILKYYLALIALFAVADIAIVAFLIILNLIVSVGTINGLIFS